MRKWAVCRVCGKVVFRNIGSEYGDGLVDSDNSPVWIYFGEPDEDFSDRIPTAPDMPVYMMERVNCGCSYTPKSLH